MGAGHTALQAAVLANGSGPWTTEAIGLRSIESPASVQSDWLH
jgi:hypothetical protein